MREKQGVKTKRINRLSDVVVYPLILEEDDIFCYHPTLGEIVYRIPALNTLLGVEQ